MAVAPPYFVIPAKAGTQRLRFDNKALGPGFRRDDGGGEASPERLFWYGWMRIT
jgi:hypothetical protein